MNAKQKLLIEQAVNDALKKLGITSKDGSYPAEITNERTNEIEVKEHEILFDGIKHHRLVTTPYNENKHLTAFFDSVPNKGEVIESLVNGLYYRIVDEPIKIGPLWYSMSIEKINL